MKNKCTVIQINGFRGLLVVGFVIVCAVAGFIVFPAWCCQHAWNYLANFVNNLPLMDLRQGVLLWAIVALVSYLALFGKFRIAVVSPKPSASADNFDDIDLFQNIKKEIAEEIDKEEIKK